MERLFAFYPEYDEFIDITVSITNKSDNADVGVLKWALLNPSGKSAKYAAEIKRGVRYTNDGRVKRDDKGNAQKLTAKQRAYRAGYLDRGKDSAKAYNSKKEKRAAAKNKKF